MNTRNQVIFWVVIAGVLTLLFSTSLGSITLSFFFVTFLFPVVLCTSIFFSRFLLPRFLLTGRRMTFYVYVVYMIIVSIYLELLVLILSFVILADYQFSNLGKIAGDIYLMTIVLYFVVFANGLVEAQIRLRHNEKRLKEIESQLEKNKKSFINVKSNRKNTRLITENIKYIESLGDFVKIHHQDGQVVTKEKISVLEKKLPRYFLRIHRSFLVNTHLIDSYGKEEMVVGQDRLPIGRKYKNQAITFLS